MSESIRGGYFLKARCIGQSEIASAPPHVREIWDYFLRHAFWQDGKHLKRGQLSTNYKEIQEALHWAVGWRKEYYSRSQCETAMKYLKKHGMVTTRRTTGGFIVTICNYERFQAPENYENHSDAYGKPAGEPQPSDTTDEEGKKKGNKEGSTPAPAAGFPHDLFKQFRAAHSSCERVKDFQFQQALAACPGADVAEAVDAFERQVAGAGRIPYPVREFEKYLRRSVGKKEGGRKFDQKNAAQDSETRKAITGQLQHRPEGTMTQAEKLKQRNRELNQ